MSWTRKVRHPSKVVSVGEEIDAVVLDIKPDSRRISLGMKQVKPNPWDIIAEKYPVGTTIEGKIKNITDFGLFIGIDEGIDGLVHISDISWTKRIKHPSEVYKKGDVLQAIVLDIEKNNERFSLGVKQLQQDPWKSVAERYEVGKEINRHDHEPDRFWCFYRTRGRHRRVGSCFRNQQRENQDTGRHVQYR